MQRPVDQQMFGGSDGQVKRDGHEPAHHADQKRQAEQMLGLVRGVGAEPSAGAP